jgi:hypothetical protein
MSGFEISDGSLRSLTQEVKVEGLVVRHETLTNDPNLGDPFEFSFHVKNKGLQPICACELWARLDRAKLPSQYTYTIPFDQLNQDDLRIIAPEIEKSKPLIKGYSPIDNDMPAPIDTDLPEILAKALTFRLRFTDAAGRSWVRSETGRLRRLYRWQKPPPPSIIRG